MQTQIDTYTFTCPECAALLRVPQNKAGISGPCPSCQNVISSPNKLKKNPDIRDIETKLDEPARLSENPYPRLKNDQQQNKKRKRLKMKFRPRKV